MAASAAARGLASRISSRSLATATAPPSPSSGSSELGKDGRVDIVKLTSACIDLAEKAGLLIKVP